MMASVTNSSLVSLHGSKKMKQLYTIGHSTHTVEYFIELLSMHSITAVCDVRSSPYSKYNPQFNRENLIKDLQRNNIAYVYLGKELGPRSDDSDCFVENKVQYDRLAKTTLFQEGLDRVREGIKTYTIALMCAEKDPITCHRTILVCRHLRDKDIKILHILEDGRLEKNEESQLRLMQALKIPEFTLFESATDQIEKAYDLQSSKIAYFQKEDVET